MRGTARPSRAPRKPPSCSRILGFFTIDVLGWVTPLSSILYLARCWTAWVSEMGKFSFITLIAYDFVGETLSDITTLFGGAFHQVS